MSRIPNLTSDIEEFNALLVMLLCRPTKWFPELTVLPGTVLHEAYL